MAFFRCGWQGVFYNKAVKTAKASIASFVNKTGANLALKGLTCYINPTQSGSGDPAPDNIRPITGVSSVNVTRTGKNFIDLSLTNLEQGGINGNTGALETTSNRVRNANYYPFPFDTLYDNGTIITIPSGYRLAMRFYNKNGSYISGTGSPIGFITELQSYFYGKGVEFVKFLFARTDNANITPSDISTLTYQLEIGSQATSYEPYTGNTYTIALGDTYYGATLDVVRGKLRVTHWLDEYDGSNDETWSIYSSSGLRYSYYTNRSHTQPAISSVDKWKSNSIPVSGSSENTPEDANRITCRGTFYSSKNFYIFAPPTDIPDITALRSYLNNQPLQFWYPITPIEIDLTPTQINSLLGSNNLWHDGNGDVEAEYYEIAIKEGGN